MKKKLDIDRVCRLIEGVISIKKKPVALHEPCFAGNEWKYVKECLDTGWVSSVGKFVDEFENKLAEFTGVKRAVALINGTSALYLCLKLSEVREEDEVLIPSLTFVATANAVSYCGATPHFVDSEEKTLGIDPVKLEKYLNESTILRSGACYNKRTGCRIKAIVPVHIFGHPVDLDPIIKIADRFNLILIEDATESLGSYYRGIHTGNWGLMSALSFNGNKIVTTGGGGAILTNDNKLADEARHLVTTAKVQHPWNYFHDRIGFNFRLPNINAALGCSQLEQLPGFLASKRVLAHRYQEAFAELEDVKVFKEPDFSTSNYWLNALLLSPDVLREKNDLLKVTHERGILTRPAWTLLHQLPMYEKNPRMDLFMAENLESRLINVPSSPFLVKDHGEA